MTGIPRQFPPSTGPRRPAGPGGPGHGRGLRSGLREPDLPLSRLKFIANSSWDGVAKPFTPARQAGVEERTKTSGRHHPSPYPRDPRPHFVSHPGPVPYNTAESRLSGHRIRVHLKFITNSSWEGVTRSSIPAPPAHTIRVAPGHRSCRLTPPLPSSPPGPAALRAGHRVPNLRRPQQARAGAARGAGPRRRRGPLPRGRRGS
jgi:hypothetical protein